VLSNVFHCGDLAFRFEERLNGNGSAEEIGPTPVRVRKAVETIEGTLGKIPNVGVGEVGELASKDLADAADPSIVIELVGPISFKIAIILMASPVSVKVLGRRLELMSLGYANGETNVGELRAHFCGDEFLPTTDQRF